MGDEDGFAEMWGLVLDVGASPPDSPTSGAHDSASDSDEEPRASMTTPRRMGEGDADTDVGTGQMRRGQFVG